MARILILGDRKKEREGLSLFMEFAGHQCVETGSLQEAVKTIEKEAFDLVLADAQVGESDAEQIIQKMRSASSQISVMILAEEASSAAGLDDVITTPMTLIQSVSPQFPPVRKREAFLVLLPEQDALKMLPDLPQSAGLLNKLALLYHSQQKYKAAEQLYKRALEIGKQSGGDQQREAASILMNLASSYHDQKRYAEAEPLYQRSLELAEKAYGPKHPKVARRLRRLARPS